MLETEATTKDRAILTSIKTVVMEEIHTITKQWENHQKRSKRHPTIKVILESFSALKKIPN